MLNGHLVANMFGSNLRLLYPLSNAAYGIPATATVSVIKKQWLIVGTDGVALALYGAIIAMAYYTEAFIYAVERQHNSLRTAFQAALSQ